MIGAPVASVLDLDFPPVFLGMVARLIMAVRDWRSLLILTVLFFLLARQSIDRFRGPGLETTAQMGNGLSVATQLTPVSLVGDRIIPSFT